MRQKTRKDKTRLDKEGNDDAEESGWLNSRVHLNCPKRARWTSGDKWEGEIRLHPVWKIFKRGLGEIDG